MDILLTPFTTHLYGSELLVPRICTLIVSGVYYNAAWILPHTMTFMLAMIFTNRFKQLGRSFEKLLEESDENRVSDSDIETFRQKHQKIAMSVSKTDDFLMFHNAGAFCCQLLNGILLLYCLIFNSHKCDPVVLLKRVFWMFATTIGLCITAAGGIMINHYVSTVAVFAMCVYVVVGYYLLFHCLTRTAYLYSGRLQWYNVVLTSRVHSSVKYSQQSQLRTYATVE